MAQVPSKVVARISSTLKRFQPIINAAKSRDANESDTVIIVTDMLSDIFGYDKYSEITSECAIRGTWCDLAIIIEVKAIGSELKDAHTKQAIDYSANKGTDWVILTNAEIWRIYKVTFSKPINSELIVEINFSALNPKKSDDIELLYTLTREGLMKSALGDFHTKQQALSRFFIGAVLMSNSVLETIRRELRRISPDVKTDLEQIKAVLMNEVLKRDVVESEKTEEAQKKVSRAAGKLLRAKEIKKTSDPVKQPEIIEVNNVHNEE